MIVWFLPFWLRYLCLGLSHSAIGKILCQVNPLTPAGIEPATVLFVAQHLNHCATAVPSKMREYPLPNFRNICEMVCGIHGEVHL